MSKNCKIFGACYVCKTYAEVIFVPGTDCMRCKGKCQFQEKVEHLTCELCGTTGHPSCFMIVNDPYERCVCASNDLCEGEVGRPTQLSDEWLNSKDPVSGLFEDDWLNSKDPGLAFPEVSDV